MSHVFDEHFNPENKAFRTKVSSKVDRDDNDWEVMAKRFSSFVKIIYLLKLVVVELLLYLLLYYAINFSYRFLLDERQQEDFARVVAYFDRNLASFGRDLTFLLGFYVSLVAKRWWDQYMLLPWPDNLAIVLTGLVVTDDEESLLIRRTIVRYALLSYVLCIRRFSSNLKRHLPSVYSLVDLGLLREDEASTLNLSDFSDKEGGNDFLLASNWWLPLAWAANVVKYAKQRKHIPSDNKEIIREIIRFRGDLEAVESHVHVAIPLVYKLVVTTAVYAYFALTLIGSQNIGRESDEIDLYFPLFIVFKLVLFVGWLKVAKSIESPFGEDDADFQMHSLLKRHLRTSRVVLNAFDDVPGSFSADKMKEVSEEEEEDEDRDTLPEIEGSSNRTAGAIDPLYQKFDASDEDSSIIVEDFFNKIQQSSSKTNKVFPDNTWKSSGSLSPQRKH